MGKVRIPLILLLTACFFIWKPKVGMPLLIGALTHHFLHANIFHLAVNCLAVWTMFNTRWKDSWMELLAGLFLGAVAYAIAGQDVVGFSNVLFAVLGIRYFKYEWYKTSYACVLPIAIIISSVIPGISVLTHFFSFLGGVLVAWSAGVYARLSKDYGTARGDK